jgi:hypothetical protein
VRRADHLSRGVLPSLLCPVSVVVKPREGEAMERNRVEALKKKYL